MIAAALVVAASIVVPSLLCVIVIRRARESALCFMPVAVLIHFVLFGSVSAILAPVLSVGGVRYLASSAAAFVFTLGLLAWIAATPVPANARSRPWRMLAIAAGLAVLSVTDLAFIFGTQSFGLPDQPTKFLQPENFDLERHTVIVSALLRGDESIFLPHTRLAYQLLWHHGVTSILGVFPEPMSRFHQVAGATLFTGALLYFILYAFLLAVRADAARKPLHLLVIFLLAASALDVLHPVLVWLATTPIRRLVSTIEAARWQYFNIKLIAQTAPQHALFAASLLGLVFFESRSRDIRPSAGAQCCTVAAVLASPVLSAVMLPFWVLAKILLAPRRWLAAAEIIEWYARLGALGYVMFWITFRLPTHELLLKPGVARLSWLPEIFSTLNRPRHVPFVFIFSLGAIGALFTMIILAAGYRYSRRWFSDTDAEKASDDADAAFLMILIAVPVWFFVVSADELRRHVAVGATVVALYVVARRRWLPPSGVRRVGALVIGMAYCALAAYQYPLEMRRAYAPGAGAFDTNPAVPWAEYVCIKNYLRSRNLGLAVAAASDEGLVLPTVNEATTALVPGLAAVAHHKVSRRQRELIAALQSGFGPVRREDIGTKFVPMLRELGFNAVVWGLLEEKHWGPLARQLILNKVRPVKSCGSTTLFVFWDGTDPRDPSPAVAPSVFVHLAEEACSERALKNLGYWPVWAENRYFVIRQSELPFTERRASARGYSELFIGASMSAVLRHINGDTCGAAPIRLHQIDTQLPLTLTAETNLALRKSARQSSTFNDYTADLALDGDSDGDLADHTMTHSRYEARPWWEVDLGEVVPITAIRLYQRTDCCADLWGSLLVLVSNSPFTGPLEEIAARPDIASYLVSVDAQAAPVIAVKRRGRFVRVQRLGWGYLWLAEVEVWGRAPARRN